MLAAVDIETKDPLLLKMGPGSIRNDGEILGVGMYCPALGIQEYFNPVTARSRLCDIFRRADILKVFHNAVYDLDWLINGYGFEVNNVDDTMTRETLLDSYATSYSLDSCCARRGLIGKNKSETIDDWWKSHGGKGKAIQHLDVIPIDVVATYCLQDCMATYNLFLTQQPLLEQENLVNANDIERRLLPLLMHMRKTGIRLDWDARQRLSDDLNRIYENDMRQLRHEYGVTNLNARSELVRAWKMAGIPILLTEKGQPSFSSAVLEDCDHPLAEMIKRARGTEKLLNTFIDGQFVDLSYNGRIHASFFPALRDEGGTITGRFSSRNPNMQNVPAREDKHGKEIRSLFIPEPGHLLGAFDYKQIEYRVFLNFASGEGAEAAQAHFREHPDTDYHQMVIDMMSWGKLGKEGRHLAKNFNFGVIYGLGLCAFVARNKQVLQKTHPDVTDLEGLGRSLMNEYYRKVPFVKPTVETIKDTARRRGYVRTLSGRHQRMPLDKKDYKIVNYLVQGSASDIIKRAMVDAWENGLWQILIPHLQVHDELVFSIPQSKEGYQTCLELREIMSKAYADVMRIPLGVDTEIGPDWGHCDGGNWNRFENTYR